MVEKLHLLQKQVEFANVVFARDPNTIDEALKSSDGSKWEQAIEAEYGISCLAKGR